MNPFLKIMHIYQKLRVIFYSAASGFRKGHLARVDQPLLLVGKGKIVLGKCRLGYWPSPHYFDSYSHIEARSTSASVLIEDGVVISNRFVAIAECSTIRICSGTIIGPNVRVYDSDFHALTAVGRKMRSHESSAVLIREGVFIGADVLILKGVEIGEGCVVAAGSVVTRTLPPKCIAGGVPARVIKMLLE